MNKSISTAAVRPVSERLWSGFGWLICLLFATYLVLDRAVYNLLALIAVGIAFTAVYSYRPRLDTELRILGLVLIANLLLALPNIILARDGLISLENPLRMLLGLPLILAVMRFGLSARFICIGLAVGMLSAAMAVSWQYHVLGVIRPGIHYNPIPFSEVAMSAFAVLLAACLVIRDRLVPLYLAGLLAALYCVILSGTRGTLIAIVPIIIFLLWWHRQRSTYSEKMPRKGMLLFAVILLFMGLVLISTGSVIDRTKSAVEQTSNYFNGSESGSGVGVRMELWRGALMAGREHPLLGIGYRERGAYLKKKIDAGELKPYVAGMPHAHNDYLDALQSRGVPGLMLQILIYAILILIFIRGIKGVGDEKIFAALAGMLVTISYATYSLTEEPMFHGHPLVFFIIITSLCIGIVKYRKNPVSADNSRQSSQ